jgi:hypothetical protein
MRKQVAMIVDLDAAPSARFPPASSAVSERPELLRNRVCVALSEAAEDIRLSLDALRLEAEAMRMALDALSRINALTIACSERLLNEPAEGIDSAAGAHDGSILAALARPLGLAASATLAVNASIASSSNTLAEVSLRIIRTSERFLESSKQATDAAVRTRCGR